MNKENKIQVAEDIVDNYYNERCLLNIDLLPILDETLA